MKRAAPGHHCITCSDEGTLMRVVAVGTEPGTALCRAGDGNDGGGADVVVNVELVDRVAPGDELLVHAGVALRLSVLREPDGSRVIPDTASRFSFNEES